MEHSNNNIPIAEIGNLRRVGDEQFQHPQEARDERGYKGSALCGSAKHSV